MTDPLTELLVDLAELAACLFDVRPKEPTKPRRSEEKQERDEEKETHGG